MGALGSLWRGFLAWESRGEVKAVCQPPGAGVDLSQVRVCCFFKHQLVELPPYPPLAVSLSPQWKKSWDPSCPGTWLVCALYFKSAPTPRSSVYLRAGLGCVCSPGFRIHLISQGLRQISLDAFLHLYCCPWLLLRRVPWGAGGNHLPSNPHQGLGRAVNKGCLDVLMRQRE